MKAITLTQPYASLIVAGFKRYETRSWKTNYRGNIAIHAGKQRLFLTSELKVLCHLKENYERLKNIRLGQYPLGAVLAIAELKSCEIMDSDLIAGMPKSEIACGAWQPGLYAWELVNIRPLIKPFYIRGKQSLWNIDDDILMLVEGVEAICN